MNEYSEARPKDDVRPRTSLPKVRALPRSGVRVQKLFDNGPITLKPLVILMDFQDYRYTDFDMLETRPLYQSSSWDVPHYQEMLFNDVTYKGPNGEDFISFNQYYVQESRGMLSVKGDIYGWFTAAHNAAHYGANQTTASWLVVEAIEAMARQQNVNLTDYDLVDFYDVDGDGIVLEPDGLIDTIMIIHAGRGEEWFGGGYLGADAIWPFRGKISYYNTTETPHEVVDTLGNRILADDFVIVEQDMPLGLMAHEYGHSLELPDLYGDEEPVQYWSLMAGSYSGRVIGSMPVSFGAYCREELQWRHGGNWQRQKTFHVNDLAGGVDLRLEAATAKDPRTDAIRIDMPMKTTVFAAPFSGASIYFSGKGNSLANTMIRSFDFTTVTNPNALITLDFMTNYDIETDWDYASIQVREAGTAAWTPIAGNITTTTNPNDSTPNDPTDYNPGHGITGSTADQWINAQFDLSAYAGKNIELMFKYWSDGAVAYKGMYIDDIRMTVDGAETFFDNAEGAAQFTLAGFNLDSGSITADHYYLIEWRNHQGLDEGLQYTHYRSTQTPYDPGLLIWYVDRAWGDIDRLDQEAASHPGRVSVGVVDADQNPVVYQNYTTGAEFYDYAQYQMHDAGFGLRKGAEFTIDFGSGVTFDKDRSLLHPVFDDSRDFSSPLIPETGLLLPQYGLRIFVTQEKSDRSGIKLHIRSGAASSNRDEEPEDRDRRNQHLIEAIAVSGDQIIVNTAEEMGATGFIGFISTDAQSTAQGVDLQRVGDQTYAGTISDPDLLNTALWQIDFIVLDNKRGGRNAVYNADVYPGFGASLQVGAAN